MPKLKTHKSTKKRTRVTGSGKLIRRRGFTNHFKQKKSGGRKRRNSKPEEVSATRTKSTKRSLGI